MGKSEILMVIAGIALSIMIALVTIPTFTKGSDVAKISLINSDISSIRKVSQTYVESKSKDGNFSGINAKELSSLIPGLKLGGSGNASDPFYFKSSANENIRYIIGTNPSKDTLVFRIEGLKKDGLEVIDGAEESILKNQEKLNINTTYDSDLKKFIPNDTPKDGIVELHFKG